MTPAQYRDALAPLDLIMGDTLFMPDYDPVRPISPGAMPASSTAQSSGCASLPPETRMFMCHDYKAPGRDHYAWETTVVDQRQKNVQVGHGVSEDEFVATRNACDATVSAPTLLLPSIQVNIRAGRFPAVEANGVRYLKIPVKFKADAEAGI